MRFLPLLFLFILSSACKDVDEPNVDLRIFYSVGDCMPVRPPDAEQLNTPFSGYLDLYNLTQTVGFGEVPNPTPLRIHNGTLRTSLDPGEYQLRLQVNGSTGFRFDVTDSQRVEGNAFLRKCTSY